MVDFAVTEISASKGKKAESFLKKSVQGTIENTVMQIFSGGTGI